MQIEGFESSLRILGTNWGSVIYEITIRTPDSNLFKANVKTQGPINERQAFDFFKTNFKEFFIELPKIQEFTQSAKSYIDKK